MDENSKPIACDAQTQISALVDETWQQLREGMQTILKMTENIEQSYVEITEEIQKCNESADLKTKVLEEDKERVQKAAIAVLEMLNHNEAVGI